MPQRERSAPPRSRAVSFDFYLFWLVAGLVLLLGLCSVTSDRPEPTVEPPMDERWVR